MLGADRLHPISGVVMTLNEAVGLVTPSVARKVGSLVKTNSGASKMRLSDFVRNMWSMRECAREAIRYRGLDAPEYERRYRMWERSAMKRAVESICDSWLEADALMQMPF